MQAIRWSIDGTLEKEGPILVDHEFGVRAREGYLLLA
jgi:hypothetical protein